MDLSPEEREVLDRRVPPERQTGDPETDWVAVIDDVWRVRRQNSYDARIASTALHRHMKSWRKAARRVGMSTTTFRNLGRDPNEVAAEEAAQDPLDPDGES